MRVLLVEDDDRISRPLAEDLIAQQYLVEIARDGIEGWEYAQAAEYDLILLDLMLPRLDGISLCKRLRASGYKGFVLMLTAKDMTADKIVGLNAGADDYLIKPFDLEELEARMRALLRRPPDLRQSNLSCGNLAIDPSQHAASYGGQVLDLTPKEYLILECMLRNPEQVFTRSMLLDKLWELDRASGESTIRTHVNNLRNKLKAAGAQKQLIATVYGVGYRLGKE